MKNQNSNSKFDYDMIRFLPEGDNKDLEKEKFHKRRIEQKTLMSVLAALLLEEVTKNPDVTDFELKNIIKDFKNEITLTPLQKRIFNKMIKEYRTRRNNIIEFKKIEDQPDLIFKKTFGFSPKGKVRIIFGSIVIHFLLSNKDYDIIAHEEGKKNKSGGMFVPYRKDITIGRSTNIKESDESVQIHEETHALKHMLDGVLKLDRFNKNFKQKINRLKEEMVSAKKPEVKAYIVEKILKEYINQNGERIKDEIFANIREGKNKGIIKTLSLLSKELGLYDYSKEDIIQLRKFIEKEISPSDRVMVEEVINDFKFLNKSYITDAVNSVIELIDNYNFTAEMVIFFLNDVPVSLWKKEVSLIKKYKKTNK